MDLTTSTLTPKEETALFLEYLHPSDTGYIFAPYKTTYYGDTKWVEVPECTREALLIRDENIFRNCDCYVNFHIFNNEGKRRAELASACNGIYIDIDVHKKNICYADEMDVILQKINGLIEQGVLLPPTIIVKTGRGIALYYLYPRPLPTETYKEKHQAVHRAMILYIKGLSPDLDIDTSVTDLARTCRLPGTMNTKSGTLCHMVSVTVERYSIDELIDAHNLTTLMASKNPFEKTKKVKKYIDSPTSTEVIVKKLDKEIAKAKTLRDSDPEAIKAVMRERLNILDNYLADHDYSIVGKRDLFLLIYYSTVKAFYYSHEICRVEICDGKIIPVSYDTSLAINAVVEVNNSLHPSLTWTEINQCIINPVDKSPCGLLFFTDTRIISSLNLNKEEVIAYGIGKRSAAKKEAEQRKAQKILERSKIIESFQNGELPQNIAESCSYYQPSTVMRIIGDARKNAKNELNQHILSLYQSGFSKKAIARSLNVDVRTVRKTIASAETRGSISADFPYVKKEGEEEVLDSDLIYPFRFDSSEAEDLYSQYQTLMTEPTPADEMAIALETLQSGANVFVTGAAGTGKTYLIRQYLQNFTPEEREKTLVLAPTSKAAQTLGGRTIHSAMKLPLGVLSDDNYFVPNRIRSIMRVIIDEIGLCRVDLFETVIGIIKRIEIQEHRRIQVIVVGDFRQIPPVITEYEEPLLRNNYPNGTYAFTSHYWDELEFQIVCLRTIRRQDMAEEQYVEMLTRLAFGDKSTVTFFNRILPKGLNSNSIILCPHRSQVNAYNAALSEPYLENGSKVYCYSGHLPSSGELPAPKELRLAPGIRVMMITNGKKYHNGDCGTVTTVREKSVSVALDRGPELKISAKSFKIDDGSTYRQLPLVIAYAITVHRAQGLTFPAVNIVGGGFFAPGLLYVALSRCARPENIHLLSDIKESDVVIDIDALRMVIPQSLRT